MRKLVDRKWFAVIGIVGTALSIAFLWRAFAIRRELPRVSLSEYPAEIGSCTPQQLGFETVQPAIDPTTGFKVGGVNQSATIHTLTSLNGQPISLLEARMRPRESEIYDFANEQPYEVKGPIFEGSNLGFLGETERLLDVMLADNQRVVDQWKWTHQDLARPLLLFGYYAQQRITSGTVRYGPFRFRISCQQWKGYQYSPFMDNTRTDADITVENLDTGSKLTYSLLVPAMIERYGFYEGQGTPYRVSPESICELLHLQMDSPSTTACR